MALDRRGAPTDSHAKVAHAAATIDFRQLLEQLPAITYVVSAADDTPLYTSPQAESILGYSHDDFVARPSLWLEQVHPDDRAGVAAARDRTRLTGEPLQCEYRMKTRTGNLIWFRDEATVVRDQEDRPLYMQGVMLDVTDRKQAEAGLEQTTQRYRSLFENNVDGIFALDASGTFLSANPGMERICGCTVEELIGKSWEPFIVSRDRQRVLEKAMLAVEGSAQHYETTVHHKDGRLVEVAIINVPMTVDGKVVGLYGILHDITEQKRTEQALRASERRARAIFDGAGIGAALADMTGRLVEANRAYQEMVGYSAEELRSMRIATVTHPDDAKADWDLFQEFVAGGADHHSYEKRYIHRDGRILWGHITRTLIRDADGNPEFCLGMVQNITERKVLEEQLRQSQKMEAVGRLAGGVAHDFNNLIAVIQSYARFLVEDMGPDDPRTEDAEEIVKAGERAATLVRQLLTFSRKKIGNPEVVLLNDIVLDMEKLLRRTIGEDIDLRTRLAPGLWKVCVDQGGIEQILANLAVNARDAMQDGGALTIETLNLEVDDRFVRRHPGLEPGPYVCLGFSDTGTGMPPDVVAQIFDPFYTTKARGEGTGLGLSTVYGIVEQVGGQVFVYSEPGVGTAFEIYVPAIDGPDTGEAVGETKSDPPVRKILLAEDEHAVRGIIVRILGRNGFEVVGGAPEQAMQIAESGTEEIGLVLTDVVMPQISGVEIMKAARNRDSSVPVLFMSGYSEDILETHSVIKGGASFIPKPFTEHELVEAVRVALESARS